MQTVAHQAAAAGPASLDHRRVGLLHWTVAALLSLGLAACGGKEKAPAPPATSATAVIGPAGGTLTGPDGVQVTVPPGALSQATTIGIARSSAGAPAAPEAYPLSGRPVYELTPHDLLFSVPVTIRAPIGSAPGTELLMASPGQAWTATSFTSANGIAEWQRNSFSWLVGVGCTVPVSMIGDPWWCQQGRSVAQIAATPAGAMTQTKAPPDPANGAFGSYRVDQPASLQLSAVVRVPGNCFNVSVEFLRRRWAPPLAWTSPSVLAQTQTIATQSPAMTQAAGTNALTGTASVTVPFSHLDGGQNQFVMVTSYDCPGVTFTPVAGGPDSYTWDPGTTVHRELRGDAIIVEGNVPAPTVFYAIGGAVNGLSGSGLILQDNGGDDLRVLADGSFAFATPVGAGTPYAVTVLTQPSNPAQVCTVQNGSGTASANVTNVAVTCVAAQGPKSWRGAGLLESIDEGAASEARVAFDGAGNAMAVWTQLTAATGKSHVWARRYLPATGWGTAEPIQAATTGDGFGPQVAFKANGDALVVWQQIDGSLGNVWLRPFTASTSSWGTATLVSGGTVNAGSPQLAIDPGGNAMVAWPEGTFAAGVHVRARRLDASLGWGGVVPLDSAPNYANEPRVTIDASGIATVVWLEDDAAGTGSDVWANRFVPGTGAGTGWGTATLLETIDGSTSRPAIASDAAGNVLVTWSQSDATTFTSALYFNRFSAGQWGTATVVRSGEPYAFDGDLAMNATGDAVAVWQEDNGQDGASAWGSRYVAGAWGTPQRIDDGVTLGAVSPQVGIDAGGNAVAVWSKGGRMKSNRADAVTGWGTLEDIDSATGGGADRPRLAVDGSGNAIAVWERPGTAVTPGADLWTNLLK
jgi:hypothetical protein